MAELFDHITDLETLQAAWGRVRANRGGPGGDGVGIEEFGREALARLLRLQRDLRAGTYRPGPVRRLDVPKRSGGTRPLAIPCIVDRVAQGAAALVLTPLLEPEMEDASFAYRAGRSVRMAVARVALLRREGYRWVVDGDIERFFENVPQATLLERLGRYVSDRRVLELARLWLAEACPGGRGLPQGSPLSPLLSNIYLDSVDEAIEGKGVRLVRFADDFVLLCKSELLAEQARTRMAALLAEHGLRLHPEKTRIVPFEKSFRFLGHLFVRSLVLEEAGYEELEALQRELAPPPLPTTVPPPRQAAPAAPRAESPPSAAPAPTADEDVAEERGRGLAPVLRVLYIGRPGRRLSLRNEAFTVLEDEDELIAIPHRRVDRIELWPGAAADDEAIRHALATDTLVAYVNGRGRTLGLCAADDMRRAALHLAQARHALEPALRLDLARRIVEGRLCNQRALLRRLDRRRKDPQVSAAAGQIGRIMRRLASAADVDALLGFEGEAAAHYWPALGRCLEHGWTLRTRERRPPPDPVNLLLSFAASMLSRDVATLAARHGLHPGFGALHQAQDGRQACVYDLMEEFRAPLAEGLAVYALNNRLVQAPMFSTTGDGGCLIHGEGRDAFVRAYEAWLDRPIASPRSGDKIAWRRLVEEQALAYARHVRGAESYAPYVMDY